MDWKAVWEEAKNWFINESKELEAELGPFTKQFASAIGQAVLTAAEKACLTFATQELSGTAKQAGAYNAIVDDLKSQSLTAATGLINSAIEVAVAKIKTPAS